MLHRSSLVLIFLLAAALSAAFAGADNWLTYHNDRYGTTIDYPDFFKPQRPPDSDDGREFKSVDGAGFWVAASYNALDFNVVTYRDFILKNLDAGAVVTYQARGDTWFVISGTKGGDIFYERHMLTHKAQLTEDFGISYPSALKSTYDPLVARMAKSFRPGTGFQSP
jgi:hypothetical protein